MHRSRRVTWTAGAAAAAVCLTVASVAMASVSSTGVTLASDQQQTGTAFDGTLAVGALFLSSHGHLGRHFCTASVVHSPAGDLLLTAAHCMSGRKLKPAGGVVFAPGYHKGRFPLGLWVVTGEYVTSRWASIHDPNEDFAFLVVSGHRSSLERAAGAERLRTGTSLPAPVDVIGYPDTTSTPIRCFAKARAFLTKTLRQLKFVCGGYTDGTSGGPFLFKVSARTGDGSIIGVIGGYQEGGYTPAISYSAVFADSIAALYRTAIARRAAPAPNPTTSPTPTPSTAPSGSPTTSPTPTPTTRPGGSPSTSPTPTPTTPPGGSPSTSPTPTPTTPPGGSPSTSPTPALTTPLAPSSAPIPAPSTGQTRAPGFAPP